jgi:NAD(P)-dependent dehydrogenase (short-subunit alcohol dehydrogenase family)
MGRLDGKVAVVTGAGSGIGRATALRFAEEGARVVCADLSGHEDAVAAGIGEAARAMHVDVTVPEDVARTIAAAEQQFGRLDVVVNNVGGGGDAMPLADMDAAAFDAIVALNLRSTFRLERAGRLLGRQGRFPRSVSADGGHCALALTERKYI